MLLIEQLDADEHGDRGADGPGGVIVYAAAEGQAEDDHQPVPDELVEEPAMLADDLVHCGEVAVQPAQHVGRGPTEAERGEAADVGEHDRGGALFAGEGELVAPLPYGVR